MIRSVLLSMMSAFVYVTMVDTQAVLCVNVPGFNGRIVPRRALDVVGSGSVGDSV